MPNPGPLCYGKTTMRYLPVMLDLAGRSALVVGGGTVARRKVSRLLEAGARVRVVATRAIESLRMRAEQEERLDLQLRRYRDEDLDGVALVFSATGMPDVERAVSEGASRRGLWMNAADDPEHCSFLMPAILERGGLQVSVSTGGASPALAARVRDEIDAALGPEYAAAVELLAELRRALPPGEARARAFADLLDGGLLEALRQRDDPRVQRMTEEVRLSLVKAGSRGAGEL